MKDEEMAEEYIEKNCKIWEEGELTVDEIVRLTFLAGLKADRPQWHKVKDGLPKESGKYLVCVGGVNGVFVIDFETEYNDFGYWCLEVASDSLGVTDTIFETITERNEDKVIAWCEIPKFDKE